MMRDYSAKKRMLKVARPIIDVFLSERSEEERREVLRRVVGKTSINTSPSLIARLTNYRLSGLCDGSYDPLTGRIVIKHDDKEGFTTTHELGHALRKYVKNDLVLASALQWHRMQLPRYKDILSRKDVVLANPPTYKTVKQSRNLRPSTFLEKNFGPMEYCRGHDETGRTLGSLAAYIEAQLGISQSGLKFLKLVDRGYNLEDAEKTVRGEQRK